MLRAVLPVHLFGCPADVVDIVAAARDGRDRRHRGCVRGDRRAASTATWAGRSGDAGAFGFYPNKQITTGEGGMLLTDREDWAELFRCLRNQGRSRERLEYARLGFNYRMDEMSAALGLAQFRRLEDLLRRRKAVADRYTARLADVTGVTPLVDPPGGAHRTWFLYVVRLAAAHRSRRRHARPRRSKAS